MVINTNTNAVEAAASLQRSSTQLSRSLARLSSGSKIINPSDDAAGLAVSEKLEAQSARIRAAKVNAQNAVSLVQTTDGFLSTIGKVLGRMSELSMLAKDITKNADDVALYGTEFQQLKEQLRDIVGYDSNDQNWSTSGSEPIGSFNGISLFGGSTLTAVIGASGDQTMRINLSDLRNTSGPLAEIMWDNSVDPSNPDMTLSMANVATVLENAIQQIADSRADLGATQSRLNIVDAQLQIQSENLMAANSRIRDVDVAEESTRLAKYNILVQSGTAMLSQANSLPESVLRLLN